MDALAKAIAGTAPGAGSGTHDPFRRVDPRAAGVEAARTFESLLVQQLVGTLRQTSQLGGEGGGMFGSGPGADTYSAWFDQRVSSELAEHGNLGVAEQLVREFERLGQIPAVPADAAGHAFRATTLAKGGLDVAA